MGTDSQARAIRRRRRYTIEQKRRIVEECLDGSESVSVVARRHDVNANLLFNWRRLYRQGLLEPVGPDAAAQLVPVRLTEAPAKVVDAGQGPTAQPQVERAEPGSMEIALVCGHRLVVRGAVEPALLRTALEVLG